MADELRHGLGRVPSPPDPNDYPLEKYMGAAPLVLPSSKVWPCDVVLDQKKTPHCVGFSGADWGNTLPIDSQWLEAQAHDLYYLCKEIDGEPNEENGSTIRSVAKALKRRGRLQAYAFTRSQDTMIQWLLTKGPLIVGTQWTEGMFVPDGRGFIHPTGDVAGGHAYVLLGCQYRQGYFTLLNSWGEAWGKKGRAKIRFGEFMQLFQVDGECMTSVELPLTIQPDVPSRDGDTLQMNDVLPDYLRDGVPDRVIGDMVYRRFAAQADRHLHSHLAL